MKQTHFQNMTITSQQKGTIHPELYKKIYSNILFLTRYHPTPEKFQEVFEENMFVKNNALAVIYVSYFLLSTLDPVSLKQKITVWPVHEKRDEGNFRIDLLKYFNELKDIYENFNLPALTMSHLISPKRYQFGVFMLRFSQLCVFTYLMKNGNNDLKLERTNKFKKKLIEKYIENITKVAKEMEANNLQELINMEKQIVESQKEDNWISEQIKLNQKNISLKQKELKQLKSDIIDDFDEASILKELNRIKKAMENSNKIVEIVAKLLSKDFMFDYKPGCVNSQENIKLNDLLRNVNKLLTEKSLEMHRLVNQDWEHNIAKVQTINKMQKTFISGLEKHYQNLTELEYVLQNMNTLQEPEVPVNVVNSDSSSLGILSFNDD